MFKSSTPKRDAGLSGTCIVSLTSFPARFNTLHRCLQSLLSQSVSPDIIMLWIAEEDIESIPRKIWKICKGRIEIKPCPDIKSFKKIIFTQRDFPDATIITCDDDVIYPEAWLETLLAEHRRHPQDVICHRARHLNFGPNGSLNSYSLWPNIKGELNAFTVFPIGVGGVLYPPGCFHPDIGDIERFTELCPHGDDIWLKTMTLLNNVQCRKIAYYKKDFKKIRGSQESALKGNNMDGGNDSQLAATFNHYHIVQKLKELDRSAEPVT